MVRIIKQKGALVLAFLFLFLAAAPRVVHGAVAIDTERACSVLIELDGTYEELSNLMVPVALYRVAEVKVDGTYQALPEFEA